MEKNFGPWGARRSNTQWRTYIVKFWTPPVKFSSIFMQFWGQFSRIKGCRPPGKSWTHPWYCLLIQIEISQVVTRCGYWVSIYSALLEIEFFWRNIFKIVLVAKLSIISWTEIWSCGKKTIYFQCSLQMRRSRERKMKTSISKELFIPYIYCCGILYINIQKYKLGNE